MANSQPQRPAVTDSPAVPDEVALDQLFRAGELYAVRAAVAAHASALGAGPAAVEVLVIVASELATNAIVHGGGSGRLLLWQSAESALVLRVSDQGSGLLDAESAGVHRQEPAAMGGRGLWIARQLADQVTIVSAPTGTEVTVVVARTGPPQTYPA